MTDAGDYGAGGVVFEMEEEADEGGGLVDALTNNRPIGIFNRSFSHTEARWSVFEREIFAGIQAGEHFPIFVDKGERVTLFTDHKLLAIIYRHC